MSDFTTYVWGWQQPDDGSMVGLLNEKIARQVRSVDVDPQPPWFLAAVSQNIATQWGMNGPWMASPKILTLTIDQVYLKFVNGPFGVYFQIYPTGFNDLEISETIYYEWWAPMFGSAPICRFPGNGGTHFKIIHFRLGCSMNFQPS